MFAYAGSAVAPQPFENWQLLFARQPEPDLDFEEDLAEDTQQLGGQSPQPGKPPKRKGTSPVIWVLLLALLSGGAYFAMDPNGAMNTVNSLIGEPTPPVAQAPIPPRPAPSASVPGSPPPPIAARPSGSLPAPAISTPGAPPSTAMTPPASPTAPAPIPTPGAPLPLKPTAPLYGEGQHVTISGPAALTLSLDATGKLPGPSAKPGSPLVVLDGEYQAGNWVYNVRTDAGAKGWAQEKQLRLVP